jgi:hypothetical protein
VCKLPRVDWQEPALRPREDRGLAFGQRSVRRNVAQATLFGRGRKPGEAEMVMPGFGDAYSDVEIAAANYGTERFGAAGSRLTTQNVAWLRLTR